MCAACKRMEAKLKGRRLLKPTHGVMKEGGTYDVVANSGRPEGRFKSRAQADKRVREIEYFKHAKG